MKYIPQYEVFKQRNRKIHSAIPGSVDKSPYIYFLLKEGVIIYIGKTRSIRARVINHNCFMPYDQIRLIQCDLEKLNHYERRWITRFQPQFNSLYTTKKSKPRAVYKTTAKKKELAPSQRFRN